MDSHFVKGGLQLDNGARVEFCHANDAVQASAKRLGLYPQLIKALRRKVPERGAAALSCDGGSMIAILAWEGFADASRNGWMSVRAAPVSEETGLWLEQFARMAIGAGAPQR
jgi:hypothetical protein